MILGLVLGVGLAVAAGPLPSYRDHVFAEAWDEVDDLATRGRHDEAIARAEAIQAALGPDGSLEYLIGLSLRLKGDVGAAEVHLRRATTLAPERPEAWADLGEILMASGRYAEAADVYANVTRLVTDGPHAWLGPWRQAEAAGWLHQPEAFEAHLRVALQRGFSFKTIAGLPNWRAYYADPALHEPLEKLLTVYSTPETMQSLQPGP